MSRAYRIKVRESLDRTLRAEDSVSTHLEILEVLPRRQMADLLAAELENAGYQREGAVLARRHNGVVISVDPASGEVSARAIACEEVQIEAEEEGRAFDHVGPSAKAVHKELQQQLQSDLAKEARRKQDSLQSDVTDRLEGELIDLGRELDGAVNRATAAALKIKAAQLGEIKEIIEDRQTGSLTIVLEV